MRFRQLAIPRADDLFFGTASKLLTTRLGDGIVYLELNFTLPLPEVPRPRCQP